MNDIDRAIQVAEERRELAAPLPWRAADGGRVINADHLSILEPVHAFPSNYASAQVAAEDALPLAKALRDIFLCVYEQAEDVGLWFLTASAPETYLQEALRNLHHVVEKSDALQAWARGVLREEAPIGEEGGA